MKSDLRFNIQFFSAAFLTLSLLACGQSGNQTAPIATTRLVNTLGTGVNPTTNMVSFKIETHRNSKKSVHAENEFENHNDHQLRPSANLAELSLLRAFSSQEQRFILCQPTSYGSVKIIAGDRSLRSAESLSMDMLNFPFGTFGSKVVQSIGASAFQGRVINQREATDFIALPSGSCDYRLNYYNNGAAGHLSGKFSCQGIASETRPGEYALATGKFDCDISAQ